MTEQRGDQRLDGWKSIARHLGRDERTVKRWEARGLPVRRVPGGARAPVYTTAAELDRWLNVADQRLIAELDEDVVPPTPSVFWTPSTEEGGSSVLLLGGGDSGADEAGAAGHAPAQVNHRPASTSVPHRRLVAALAVVGIFAVGAFALAPGRDAATHAAAAPTPATSIDPQAREHYLDGLHAWNLRTPASLAQAHEDFGAAIAREPGYAPAYAGLANDYLLLREFGAMSDAEAYPKAMAAAETALHLDPNLAAAHRARAFALYWGRHQSQAAWAEFDRAGALAPGEALTWHWYATALDGAGRYAEAARMIERARALDPASTAILADKGVIVYSAGDRAQGRALEQRVLALDPTNIDAHRDLARMAVTEGRDLDANAEWQHVVALGGSMEIRGALSADLVATPSAKRAR